jgi:hypothetical protein
LTGLAGLVGLAGLALRVGRTVLIPFLFTENPYGYNMTVEYDSIAPSTRLAVAV